MPGRDKRVDAYITRSAPFARPILKHLRAVVHEACPEAEETLKWGMPAYMHHGILCITAAFKAHCAVVLWKRKFIVAKGTAKTAAAMGDLGRITSLKGLPSKRTLAGYLRQAKRLNEEGTKSPAARKSKKKPVPVPADLAAGLKKSAKARAAWADFSPSARRDYIEWIMEAKRAETRAERLKTTLAWVAQGKMRNWKYA